MSSTSSLAVGYPPEPLLRVEELTAHINEMNRKTALPDNRLHLLPRRLDGFSVLEAGHKFGSGLVVLYGLR